MSNFNGMRNHDILVYVIQAHHLPNYGLEIVLVDIDTDNGTTTEFVIRVRHRTET